MGQLTIRPSGFLKYDDCAWAYKLQYVLGIRTVATSANLSFGTAFHHATTTWLLKEVEGQDFDIVGAFEKAWQKELDENEISFNTLWDPESMKETGVRLVEQFPERWSSFGLVPLIDNHGPVIERRFQAELAPGVIVSAQPDIIAMDMEGRIVAPDIKTPATPSSEAFLKGSEQLTLYQMVLDAHLPSMGYERIDKLGFIEALKKKVPKTNRGTGPVILDPALTDRRDERVIQETRQKLAWMAEDINNNRFPKRPRMAFNTPCDMCDFANLCLNGDPEGLSAAPGVLEQVLPKVA